MQSEEFFKMVINKVNLLCKNKHNEEIVKSYIRLAILEILTTEFLDSVCEGYSTKIDYYTDKILKKVMPND